YASPGALPRKTQNSLPAAGQALPDGTDYPQGCDERFRTRVVFLSRACLAQGHAVFLIGYIETRTLITGNTERIRTLFPALDQEKMTRAKVVSFKHCAPLQ